MRRANLIVGLVTALIAGLIGFALVPDVKAQSIEELRRRREQLSREIERNRKASEQKKQEAQQLSNQIKKLEDDIAATQVRIAATQSQIDDTTALIEVLKTKIAEKQRQLDEAKERQRQAIIEIHVTTDNNLVYLVVGSTTLSDAVDRAAYLEALESTIEKTIEEINAIKAELQSQKKEQEDRQAQLEQLKRKQEIYQKGLASAKQRKGDLLSNTKKTLAELEKLVEEARREYQNVNSELYRLTQLAKKGRVSGAKRIGNLNWYWPFDGLVTTEFCERTRIQECHTGTDIDGNIGDENKAAADGVVVFAGGDRKYGYGLYAAVDHGNGVTSIYGHCDTLNVSLGDKVEGGKTTVCFMGNTGYAYAFLPGGDGSHVHFEIREDGVPVNPRIYLP